MDDYFIKQKPCETKFNEANPMWHLCTSGEISEIIFTDCDDFSFGMTTVGLCKAACPNVLIYAFTLMSNHVHFVLSGEEGDCREFFRLFKYRLKTYYRLKNRTNTFYEFNCRLLKISDLSSARNEIAYVHRNGYLVTPGCTPFSYKWGTGMFYYTGFGGNIIETPVTSLTYRQKRLIFHNRGEDLPDNFTVFDNYVCPTSFCNICDGMGMYLNAHQYFRLLSRTSGQINLTGF